MKNKIFVLISLLLSSLFSNAQNRYVLDLKAQKWELKPSIFYIAKIVDNRQDKKNAGEALAGEKIVPIFFLSLAGRIFFTNNSMCEYSLQVNNSGGKVLFWKH